MELALRLPAPAALSCHQSVRKLKQLAPLLFSLAQYRLGLGHTGTRLEQRC